MGLAKEMAKASKDASSKIGAVLVRPDKSVASVGFNGFPKRMIDNKEWLTNPEFRHKKYPRIVHAEANCLDHRRDFDTQGYHMIVSGHPCSACALKIANTGIEYVYYEVIPDFEARWAEDLVHTRDIFEECGIKLIRVEL